MKDVEGDEKEDRNVFKLLTQLRKEKLLVRNEKLHIQKLNKSIKKSTDTLLNSAWVAVKQRLYLLAQRDFTNANYEHMKTLVGAEFVDAKTIQGFSMAVKYENLFNLLRSQPEHMAKMLISGEQLCDDYLKLLQSLVTGLYCSCIFSEDAVRLLRLLYELAKLQLGKRNENPCRLLKQSISFKTLYFIFHEVLPSAKFFLSGALELPILRLLSYREFYLDVDPEKTLMRYRQSGCLKNEFSHLQAYRNEVVRVLSELTDCFMCSLRENMYSFPKCIAWIIYQISKIVAKSSGPKEANAVVTELMFTLYICPAIVDPEQYSICDTQITNVARHNLIQIAQILQVLALSKHEKPDAKYSDLYKTFDNDVVVNFMEEVLYNFENDDEPPVDITPEIGMSSKCVLFSEEELNHLISFLQKVQLDQSDQVKKSQLDDQISSLIVPSSVENSPKNCVKNNQNGYAEKKMTFMSMMGKTNLSKSRDEIVDSPMLTVLVFGHERDVSEPFGLLSEERVMDMKKATLPPSVDVPDVAEGSIGNTSDNLEAISEAASNHSVASSLELEENDQNDNLSDMISANVSGRGTPNISGRDTPSSQVNENEERPLPEARLTVQPQPISRQIRSEIDDKFCKFEIKKLMEGDETISIISETWSTDVLASDNETIDTEHNANNRTAPSLMDPLNQVAVNNLDLSETQSESAWSTDVISSDTERLTEVDNDDAASVAQSDETRSEIDENVVSRRPSNAAPTFHSYYQEYRKVEIKNDVKTDTNANNLTYKSVTTVTNSYELKNAAAESSSAAYPSSITSSTPGPSGFRSNVDRPSEILLSNCSLNSSSSGSSSSNGGCYESKHHVTNSSTANWLNSSESSLNNVTSTTPSESTSELSVLSVNNRPVPMATKKNSTAGGTIVRQNNIIKPSASTGAIPKSISFDTSVDKDDDLKNHRKGSFFGKLKIGFKNRRVKSFRHSDEFSNRIDDEFEIGGKKTTPNESPVKLNSEVSDDILAKYRPKSFIEPSIKISNGTEKTLNKSNSREETDSSTTVDNTFDDIKKKLRIVLSNTTSQAPKLIKEKRLSVKSKIETILRLELGKCRKLKEWSNIARISETLRFINLLNENTCLTLIQSMHDDYLQRFIYIQYLINSRQELLHYQAYLESLADQIKNDEHQCEDYLSTICLKQFLLEEEERVIGFCEEFKNIVLPDEKYDYLNNFYKELHRIMQKYELWQNILKYSSEQVEITLERCIMSKVYSNALYPNGDGDRHRDHVLYRHIENLARIITPDHKALMIPKMFLRELPWIPAQEALKAIGAYKTPRDKVNSIVRCAKCIMDLLAFSQNSGSTTADDFTPVLVYVIIRVNPRDLLSTIQFVNSFYSNQLGGEEMYWWTQFCSAVEFIKTMDYSD